MTSQEPREDRTPDRVLRKIQEAKEKQLKQLDLEGRQYDREESNLTRIPAEVFELKQLEILNLSFNKITVIPDAITQLQNLTVLDLSNNRIAVISDAIGQLKNLTKLDLFDNQITVIPDSIAHLKSLTELYLYNNRITVIPNAITHLQNLSELDLSINQITVIPDSIAQAQNLTKLYLSHNQITAIPVAIAQLQNLIRLNLYKNQITVIPGSITQIQNLTDLSLAENPLRTPPLEVAEKGIGAIRKYFQQQEEEGIDRLYEAKLLVIGEGGAGKTSLAKKIENPKYQLVEREPSTEGIEVIQWYLPMKNGKQFRVNIWDFGGQEIYHATHQFFLTKRSLYVLVADSRKEDTDFHYWLNIVELLSENSPLLIIKNEKHDRHREINEAALRGQFTNLEKTLATNLATNRGLDDILKEIKHQIAHLPHIGTALPKTWVRVREALERDDRDHISLEEYFKICHQNGFKKPEDALQLSGYLHDLGVCLHFQDDDLLTETVILKPKWGTDAVYKVLDSEIVIGKLGRFDRADLSAIWHEATYAHMRGKLLQVMIKFRLCYQIPNRNEYIAPQLLTINQPDYHWDESNNLILRYTYEFMPKGILTQFIVSMHQWIDEQKYVWRSGVILQQDNAKAEVIENYGKREIKVRVIGKDKKRLMDIVTYEIDKIHATYKRLKYQKLIPCNCAGCKNQQDLYFYPLETLRRFIDNQQREIQCQKNFDMVNVLGLIDDIMDRTKLSRDPRDIDYKTPREIAPTQEVFISYAWGGESEEIVNQVDRTFQQKGITIVRDKRDLEFKGSITQFMQRIGRGKCVIVVISQKYLKSENCMFELVEIAANQSFKNRIFPIVLDDAKIYKPLDRIQYLQHWEQEKQSLDEAMKSVGSEYLQGFRESIDLYTKIRMTIADLTNTLKDMNTLTAKIHSESGFEELFEAVDRKLNE
ncbi:COR domain-containing protein [Phormidesmis sp. 146-33]